MSKRLWLCFVGLIFLLSGCSSQPIAEQTAIENEIRLSAETPVGQTFVARFDGLSGIFFTLSPGDAGDGEIRLHLRADAQANEDLAVSYQTVPIASITGPIMQGFFVPAQTDSNQKYYYAFLEVIGSGSVEVSGGPGGNYLDGALYKNHEPQDAQATFQLSYSRRAAAQGLAKEMMGWAGVLLVAAFLFILPGWGLLSVLLSEWDRYHWGEKLGLAAGVSLAMYPVFLLWTNLIGLNLGAAYAWILPLTGGYLLAWRHRDQIRIARQRLAFVRWHHLRPNFSQFRFRWFDGTLIAIILIIFAARFWIIRSLDIPLWGDSLQHAMITQLMLDNNGLFTSWQPFAPYHTMTTHFGFSTFAALYGWISGMNGTQATLWVGQIVNGLAILTLYPLASKISKNNQWAGIGALLFGGLVSILPATYVNWGRFAQLAGQAILPAGLFLLWEALDQDKKRPWLSNWQTMLLAGLALAGMSLSYYRMPFYYATFVAVVLLCWALPVWRFERENWVKGILRLLLIGLVGIGLFIPWATKLAGGSLADAVGAGVTKSNSTETILAGLEIFRTTEYASPLILGFAAVVVIVALARKNWMAAALPLWFIFLIGYMAGSAVRLPGANMLQGFTILIAIYIPMALLIGWLVGEVMMWVEKLPSERYLAAASLLLVVAAGRWGWQQRLLLDTRYYELVSRPDLRAMAWVEATLPAEAFFLAQGFQYVQTVAGSDAGWWLPLLAQRANTIPTQYTQFNEVPTPPDFTKQVVGLYEFISEHGIGSAESIQKLCAWGVTHLYHGQGQGQVGGPALFQPGEMDAAPEVFTRIYAQDRVSIYALNQEACIPQP